jgi:Protein of Unknown function (DUF2604)/WXG100 protein secretion system (Wss), protein YukD
VPDLTAAHTELEITIVVSGQPERLKARPHEKLEHLVREALKRSGNEGQPPSDWELRAEDGQIINQEQTVAEAGIADGQTLFLSPKAGAGGSTPR